MDKMTMTFRNNLIDKHSNEDKTGCEIQESWSGPHNEIERNHKFYKKVNKIDKS